MYTLGIYVNAVIFSLILFALLGIVLSSLGLSYINDSKFSPPKFLQHFKFLNDDDNITDEFDVANIIMSIIGIALILTLAWTIVYPIIALYLILRLLRFTYRTEKKIAKLNETTHIHSEIED